MLAYVVMYAILGHSLATSRSLRASQFDEDADDSQNPVVPAAAPKAGDLVGQVKNQLAGDHRILGKVSASLMSVQSEVDKTEASMLGKVLDLQTARSFFTRHGEINTANDKLQDDVEGLNKQVEGLSSTLSKVQREFLTNGKKYRTGEGKLHTEAITDGVLIASMEAEMSKEDDVQKALKKLTKIHDDLLAEAQQAKLAGEKSVALLNEARGASSKEVGKHRSLRHQLVSMNNYSIACHNNVEKTSKKVGQAMTRESKDNKAATMTLKQKRKANQATEQRLLAERALLVSEVKRVEHAEEDTMARMKDLREDRQILEKRIVDEVRDLQAEIVEAKEKVKTASTALMENVQAMEQDLKKKEMSDTQISELIRQIHNDENPITIATFEGQNDALQTELTQAYQLWKTVKKAETSAALNAEQAVADLDAAKHGLKLSNEELEATRTLGQKNLADAVKTANINKDRADALILKAEAAIAGKCKSKWDVIAKRKRKKVQKCDRMESELELEKAKKESLMTTLKARAEAQA